MDIRSLKYFICIADCQGITAAAERLNMTQPPLSTQLKAMEEELGFPLFYRRNKIFLLTREGRLLYERGKAVVEEFDDMLETFRDMRSGITGSLRIGATASFAVQVLPPVIQSFTTANPGICVQLRQDGSRALISLLTNNEIDLAVIKSPRQIKDCQCLNIDGLTGNSADGETYAVGQKRYFSSRGDSVSFEEIGNMPVILHIVQQEYFMECCRLRGIYPQVIGTNADAMTSLTWCAQGLGVALLSSSALHLISLLENGSSLAVRRFDDYRGLVDNDYLVWREDCAQNPMIRLFVGEVRRLLQKG